MQRAMQYKIPYKNKVWMLLYTAQLNIPLETQTLS